MDRLAEQTDTRLRFRAEVLAGSWECLEDGPPDLLISSLNADIAMTGIKHQVLREEVMLYVAHPDHPLHQEPEPPGGRDPAPLSRHRGGRHGAAQTGAHLPPARQAAAPDRQHHGEKRDALLAGLGIGTMPQRWIEEDIKAGRLKVISPEYRHQIQVVLAWRRDTMGKAKSWLVREIPSCLPVRGIIPIGLNIRSVLSNPTK